MSKITYYGLYWVDDFLALNPEIEKIIERYSLKCPKDFSLNVSNDTFRGHKIVSCKRIRSKVGYNCQLEYIYFSSDSGYFGCRKLASCEESGEGYVEFGDKRLCAVCQAGGWVDQDRTKLFTEDPVVYCKVDAKNPDDQSVCAEEVKEEYYEDGEIKKKRFYEDCSCILEKKYDKDGILTDESEGLHGKKSFIHGEFRGYYETGSLKREGKKKYSFIEQNFYDRAGNHSSQSEIYHEEMRLKREKENQERRQKRMREQGFIQK